MHPYNSISERSSIDDKLDMLYIQAVIFKYWTDIMQTSIESAIFERAINIFRPSRVVLTEAIKLLKHYQATKSNTQMHDPLPEIAVLVGESCQQLRDVRGRRISGIGLSLSRFINHSAVPTEQLISKLKQFLRVVPLEQVVRAQLEHYANKASQALAILKKFESFVEDLHLEVRENIERAKYKSIFVDLGWVLYIDCKENYFQSKTITEEENFCLMASVFYFMIRYSMDHVYPRSLKDDRSFEKRLIISHILQLLLDVFQIENVEQYRRIAEGFDDYAENLIASLTFRTVSSDTDFFSPLIIHLNYKQLQNQYQKKLNPDDIDYRVFRRQSSATPIHKEALVFRVEMKNADTQQNGVRREYKSHRALDYEEQENAENSVEIILKNQRQTNTTSTFACPFGVNLEIYRYVKGLLKHDRIYSPAGRKMEDKITAMWQSERGTPILESVVLTVQSVYWNLLKKIENNQQLCLEDPILGISIFLVDQMFHQTSTKRISDYLPNQNCGSFVTLWYCLSLLYKDENLPPILKEKYRFQSLQIMCQTIWQKGCTYADELAEMAANYPKNHLICMFTETVISYCQNFIAKMGRLLEISKQHSRHAYNCLKYIFSADGSILEGHHIDQVLMCAIYISGKTVGEPVLFARIKQVYQIVQRRNPQKCERIINCVHLQNTQTNIIGFYNSRFIQKVQPFVPYMSNPSFSLLHPLFQRQMQFEQHAEDHFTITTLLQTQKPKPPYQRVIKEKNEDDQLLQGERNETRARARPANFMQKYLCQTEKTKVNPKPLPDT